MADTLFAPAAPDAAPEVERQAAALAAIPLLPGILDQLPFLVAILNPRRQIVWASRAFSEALPPPPDAPLLGLRPGELVDCVFAAGVEGGCGTAEECTFCGAVEAILRALEGKETAREARIRRRGGRGDLDLRVTGIPFRHQGEEFVLLTLQDITDEKRRQVMEHLFFHDVLNTASALQLSATVLKDRLGAPEKLRDLPASIEALAQQITMEIKAQRELRAAERGELAPVWRETEPGELLRRVVAFFEPVAHRAGRELAWEGDGPWSPLVTDRVLALRVVENMVRNALEASAPGETVTVGAASREGGGARFWVRNPQLLPPAVKAQLFQRFYSTKGEGRGLGTYSMKLLGEGYLGGRVWFTSLPGEGTTFFLELPCRPPDQPFFANP